MGESCKADAMLPRSEAFEYLKKKVFQRSCPRVKKYKLLLQNVYMGRARKNLTFSILQIESYSFQPFVTQIVLPRFTYVVACARFYLVVLFFLVQWWGLIPGSVSISAVPRAAQ